jgi:hypothetical protein
MAVRLKEWFAKEIHCKNCNRPFIRQWSNNIYCSQKCKTKFYYDNFYVYDDNEKLRCKIKSEKAKYSLFYRYRLCKNNARRRNIAFCLTRDEFNKIYGLPCHYCGITSKIMGIDRLDSMQHYFPENCVSACKYCNWMKTNMALNDFIKLCNRIARNHPVFLD